MNGLCHEDQVELRNELRSADVYALRVEEIVEEILNNCGPDWNFGGCKYLAGQLLREVDPVHFRCVVADHVSFQLEDDQWVEIAGEYFDADKVNQFLRTRS